ncbi:MAG: DUF4153 domain-containing protein [Lachnospiraceae bacterium]|nr:DUF4153 domain-containing protein [Lachnospiraceae bacterium]
MKRKMQELLSEYKITLCVLVIWLVASSGYEFLKETLAAIDNQTLLGITEHYLTERFCEGCFRFLILFGLGCLLAEICFKDNLKKKLAVILTAGVVSAILSYFITVGPQRRYYDVVFIKDLIYYDRSREWVAAYMILMLSAIVFISFKRSGMIFSRYVAGQVLNMLVVFGLSLVVLIIGLVFLLIVEALFESASAWTDTCMYTLMYLTCFCMMVGGVWSLNGTDENKDKEPAFAGNAFQLLPMVLIGAAGAGILGAGYIYGAKLLLFRQLPSNEVFEVISWIFALCLPAWIIGDGLRTEGIYHKVLTKLPWIFAPLMLLQILSMGIRIYTYGLTQERYLGVMLILFEIIALVLWKVCREHMEGLLIVLAGLTVIAVLFPWVNMTSLSRWQQEKWLVKYLQTNRELTETEYQRLQGAYEFLWEQKGQAYMQANYGERDELLEEYVAEEVYDKKWYSIHGCQMVGALNTTGFVSMNMLNQSETYDDDMIHEATGYIEVDFSKFRFVIRETGEEIVVDISELYKAACAYAKENPSSAQEEETAFLKQQNVIGLKDGSALHINHFEVSWFTEMVDGEEVWRIRSINISGMLLEK